MKLLLHNSVALLAMLIFAVSLTGCKEEQRDLIIGYTLRFEIEVGDVVRLNSLMGRSDGIVCVLGPYQNRVGDEEPSAEIINAQLTAIDFIGDEDYWVLVHEESGHVTVTKYYRFGGLLDIGSWDMFPQLAAQYGIDSINHANCLPLAQASFRKIEYNERPYLILERAE